MYIDYKNHTSIDMYDIEQKYHTESLKKTIRKGMEEFANFCLTKESRDIFLKNAFVAGSTIANMINGYTHGDIDYFFKTKESFEVVKNDLTKRYSGAIQTENAITLTHIYPQIQAIGKVVGNPFGVISKFDYEHTKCFYDYDTDILHISNYECIKRKVLEYTGSEYPINSILRMKKFMDRGYSITEEYTQRVLLDVISISNISKSEAEKQMVGFYEDIKYDALFEMENKNEL